MNIAIIPARGGSKRIPLKNIREFCGKPIIAYSIEAAKRTNLFKEIVVSTDSERIAEVAIEYGAVVPFKRPNNISDDYSSTLSVISHATQWYTNNIGEIDYICCIYPTAPLIDHKSIIDGFNILKMENKIDFVFSVTSYRYPIYRSFRLISNNRIQMIWPENEVKRSQDLPQTFHDAGQFYWGTPKTFINKKNIFSKDSRGIILPHFIVQDIDTEEDWKRAEILYKAFKSSI